MKSGFAVWILKPQFRISFEAHSPEWGPLTSRHGDALLLSMQAAEGTEVDLGSRWRKASGSLRKAMALDHMSTNC